MDETTERPLGPTQEGSEQALLVLRHMNDWRSPISCGKLAALTGLDAAEVSLVLRGLRARHRVVMLGVGPAALWQLPHHHQATQRAAS